MKKRYLFTITAIAVAAIMITACGSTSPEGSSAQTPVQGSSVQSADKKTAETDLIEVDVKNLPEGITKDDLTKDGNSYYLDQTEFKKLAKALGKNITVSSVDGFAYTANAAGNMVTRLAGTDAAAKQTGANGTTPAGTNPATGTNQTSTGGAGGANSGNASAGGYGGNSGAAGSGNTSGGGSSSGSASGGNSGGGSSTPAQPVHQHTWVAHTTTVDQGWYEDIVEYHQVCKGCGAILDGYSNEQLMDHMDACGTGYMGTNVVVGQRWVSNPVTVTDYYYCSGCGAIQ